MKTLLLVLCALIVLPAFAQTPAKNPTVDQAEVQKLGAQMKDIDPSSLYAQLGLKNGDIITEINGQPLTNPEKLLKSLENLRTQKEIVIKVKRGSKVETIRYSIK